MKHRWTPEDDGIVRVLYRQNWESAGIIAQRIGCTQQAVKSRAQNLGLGKKRGQRWDSKQDERLRELMVKYSPGKVARLMNRGVNSVVVRSKRLRIHRSCRDWYTKKDVAEICGVDHHKVQYWKDNDWLKATYHNGHRPQKNGMVMWHIERKDFKRFIRTYPNELGHNLDIVQIVEILAGLNNY